MKFKYHKSYRGFYLLEEGKFKRPYQKLDQEETAKNVDISFELDKIIEIPDEVVVFVEKDSAKKTTTTKKQQSKKVKEEKIGVDFEKLELKYHIPSLLLRNLYSVIKVDAKDAEKELASVLAVVENVIKVDGLFASKVQKIFFYNESELTRILNRYNLEKIQVTGLKQDIELNYPSQYISELPIDYKEYEMIFVFYFIILVELLAVLK